MSKVEVHSLYSENEYSLVKEVLSGMEPIYCNEYVQRFLPLLKTGNLREVFCIYEGIRPIGVCIFKEESKKIYFTMFRILPDYRGKGYGKAALLEILQKVFRKYNIDNIYASSVEFGALKLYHKLGAIFLPSQTIDQINVDQFKPPLDFKASFLGLPYKNNARLSRDIFFYFSKEHILNS